MLCYFWGRIHNLLWIDGYQNTRTSGGMILKSMELAPIGVERRRYAVEEIRFSLARVYRGFVLWTSMYGETDGREERERRERVDQLLDQFHKSYLPRSMWLADDTRGRIEAFAQRSRELRTQLSTEVEEKGYEKSRTRMSRRVTKKLRPARKQVEVALEMELADPKPSRWRRKR